MKDKIKEVEESTWNLNSLQTVELLSNDKLEKLRELKEDLLTKANQLEQFRPEPLMRISVLKDVKFPTPDAKYWQAILERDVMFKNLLFLAVNTQEKLADIEIKECQIDELVAKKTPLAIATAYKIQIIKNKLLLEISFAKKEANDRYREILTWTKIIKELEPKCKHSTNNPEEHLYETVLLKAAKQAEIIQKIGASDMNGAINILGIGETAAKEWKKRNA